MSSKVLKKLYTQPISFDIGSCSYFFEPSPSCGSCFTFISNFICVNYL